MSITPVHHRPDLHELVEDLTETRSHREAYTVRNGGTFWSKGHVTKVPPLIDQLQHATAAASGEGGTAGYASRPAALLESIDTLIHIDLAAARWVRDLGEDDPGDTKACLRKLHSLHPSAHRCSRPRAHHNEDGKECCTQHAIESDIRHWWTQARIVTGWDSPAWRPNNTCPLCGTRGTLRIKLAVGSGMCIECRETWDEHTIGLLADHILDENAELADTP